MGSGVWADAMCNPSLQQPLSTNVDGEGTEGSFWEWETGICHHPARRRGGAAVVLGLLACLPAIASEPRPSRPIPAFVAGMGSIGNMGRHVPCKGDALLRGTRGMARGQKARPRAVQLRRGECDSYSVGVRSKLLCMGLKMAGIEGGEEESSDDDDNDSFDGFDDHMYLGLSEPSFDETLFFEDSDRPAWNWDGEQIMSETTARWRMSGLDSWDTYDSDFYDPMSTIFAERANFSVPEHFDWNATTGDNYWCPYGQFYGPYAKVRAELDYTYHVNYQEPRQRLQDEIVRDWVSGGVSSDRPWMIFTAGAMGSGKSHALRHMENEGEVRLLRDMVKVDPDRIKYQLPEMVSYISRNPGPQHKNDAIVAGFATHNESGFLQELIVRELMEQGKHLVVDGSLADADWYIDYISNIRSRYPEYRIAIVHVRCNPAEVMRRVQERCVTTGRCIAANDVERSIRRTPKAVQRLSGLVDLLVEVENSVDVPFITSICMARHHFPEATVAGEKTAWQGMSRWTNPRFWRSRTVTARRHARTVVGDHSINPHMRRFWLLDDTVEDELKEGFQVFQDLLNADELLPPRMSESLSSIDNSNGADEEDDSEENKTIIN